MSTCALERVSHQLIVLGERRNGSMEKLNEGEGEEILNGHDIFLLEISNDLQVREKRFIVLLI